MHTLSSPGTHSATYQVNQKPRLPDSVEGSEDDVGARGQGRSRSVQGAALIQYTSTPKRFCSRVTHSRVCNDTRSLNLDDSLYESDTAYPDPS